MSIPSRIKDRILVVSHLKQTDYATILTDANLQAGKRFSALGPVFGDPQSARWTNRNHAYKGHDYATQMQEVERSIGPVPFAFEGDSYLAAWISYFGMGSVSSVQPNAGANPTAWRHTIKPFDPAAAGKDVPVTTIYAEAANVAGLKRRLKSCAIADFGFEFPPGAPISMQCSLIGSGEIVTGALASPPALSALNLLLSNNMTFSLGTQGAPTDITTEIVRGSVRFGFSWTLDEEHSRAPGGGLYRSRMWVGVPQPTLSFARFVDDTASTPFDDWLAGTVREIKVKVTGAQIGTGPEVHDLEIRGLALRPEGVPLGQSGDKTIYQYSVAGDFWFKEGSNDVITIIVTNTQSSYGV